VSKKRTAFFFQIDKAYYQWRAEVWRCPGRLLDCMTPIKL